MRKKINDLIPVMKCTKCGHFTDGGNRRPGVDELRKQFLFKCSHCGNREFAEVDHWEVEVEE